MNLAKIKDSLLKGRNVSTEEWTYYISIEDKNNKPINLTEEMLEGYTYNEKSSYEILANEITEEQANILELGCSNGNILKHLNLSKIEYLGIDTNQLLIDSAKEKYKQNNINFIVTDLYSYKTNSRYDYIISHLLIHMLDDLDKYFNKYLPLLKDKRSKMVFVTRGRKKNGNDPTLQIINEKVIEFFKSNYPNYFKPNENNEGFEQKIQKSFLKHSQSYVYSKIDYVVSKKVDSRYFVKNYIYNMYPSNLLNKVEKSNLVEKILSELKNEYITASHYLEKYIVSKR